MPLLEIATVVALISMVTVSYFIVSDQRPEALLTPPTVALLLVANLVPAMILMVLVARRLAMRRAARSPVGGRGRLHVRLVALFSAIASVPTLLVVIFASLLFQGGMQFWFSDSAKTVLTIAERASQVYEAEHKERIRLDVEVMGGDMVDRINRFGLESAAFEDEFWYQTAGRQLTETAILTLNDEGVPQMRIGVNLYDRPIEERFTSDVLRRLRAGEVLVGASTRDRVEAVVRLDPTAFIYLYGARAVNPEAIMQIEQARTAASAYQSTLEEARNLQLRFNAILLLVSLLIVAIAIWIALTLADRLVRPVGQLVDAARQVTSGDLSVRVPASRAKDEVGTLGNAFNRMTRRLEEQRGELVSANAQLDSRRAFTEAVLSGVSAGVVRVDDEHVVRLINSSAEALLGTGDGSAVGQKLADLAPELDRQLTSEEREEIVQFASRGETRTLAVKTVKVEGGHVLTFDDITDQLIDQRRAAWSDVARRIAHEIKNPLTPIQLAAERLQRRYAGEIKSDDGTFERLTGTIVRQVGDLRRMVDEFSSFARMPKPVFREEAIVEVARQAVFLHEVAHPEIEFVLEAPDPSPVLVCDRRLLGQAVTNVIKNAVEAIQQKGEGKGPGRKDGGRERVTVRIRQAAEQLSIEIADTGVGLPTDRKNITEPYMTTRAKGTGLGLAIVKKIVEEHFGRIEFEDGADGGTLVRILFDRGALSKLGGGIKYSEDNPPNG
ncbi:sensor histidine kinase [Allosphingosinicella sp.]|uniref:sensor histidine kinase n=1 Tax=Allosphingosinicella sp. TaxID=2823234 RepID=UPI002F065292